MIREEFFVSAFKTQDASDLFETVTIVNEHLLKALETKKFMLLFVLELSIK